MVTRRALDDSTMDEKGRLDDRLLGLDLSLQDQGVVLAAHEAFSDQQLPEREEALRTERAGQSFSSWARARLLKAR